MEQTTLKKFIRRPAVQEMTGSSKSQIYELMAAGDFPKPVRLSSGRAVAWELGEVQAWMHARLAARQSEAR